MEIESIFHAYLVASQLLRETRKRAFTSIIIHLIKIPKQLLQFCLSPSMKVRLLKTELLKVLRRN